MNSYFFNTRLTQIEIQTKRGFIKRSSDNFFFLVVEINTKVIAYLENKVTQYNFCCITFLSLYFELKFYLDLKTQ